jgi:hypothetical protein
MGRRCGANGYLPATHQGALLRPTGSPILDLNRPPGISEAQQRAELDALQWLNQQHLDARPGASELEARIHAYELAFRMQTTAPALVDISDEPQQHS